MDGYATGHGVDILEITPGRFCNFVYWLFTMEKEQKEVDKFRTKLWMPPKHVKTIDPRSPWSPENERNAFAALKAQLNPGKK